MAEEVYEFVFTDCIHESVICRLKNHAEIYSYPSKSFKIKLKHFISNYC